MWEKYRRVKPIVPIRDYLIFWGLAEYVLKNPQLAWELALKGLFTPTQIKHLKSNLRITGDVPVGNLSEKQWGIIFESMVEHVPKFRWPKLKKSKKL